MASNSQLPDFEEVKQGLLSSFFTTDRSSEAGEAYGSAARSNRSYNEGIKDDEAGLLRAVQLGHAYAPRVLYQEYKSEAYRELLLAAVSKKIKDGFKAGVKEDMALLGHTFLTDNNYSLRETFEYAFKEEDKISRKVSYYTYLIESKWRELEGHIVDVDQAEAIISSARQSLESLATQEESEACVALGRFAVKEKNLEEAKKYLLSEKTLAFIEESQGVRSDWSQAVKGYITLVNNPEKLEVYQLLGGIYKNKRQYIDAFEAFFEAYKLVVQTQNKEDSTQQNALFTECANIFQIKKDQLYFTSEKEKNIGIYRFLGYQLFSELGELGLEGYDSMAIDYLKESIIEGYTPALREILENSATIFQTPLKAAQFLGDMVTTEWEKEQEFKRSINLNREPEYYAFKDHPSDVKEALRGKLLSLYDQAQESEFDLKLSTSKSLIRLLGSDFARVTSGKALALKHDSTALFLNAHREMLNFMRHVDLNQVSEKDRKWFEGVQTSLERIFKKGIYFEEKSKELDKNLPFWMTPTIIEIVKREVIFKPEGKTN